MSDELPQHVAVEEITDTRFSVRAMLGTMAAVAVLAALLGSIVRNVDSDKRISLSVTWAIWLAGSIGWVAYLTHQRRNAERLIGRAQIKLPLYDENLPEASAPRRWFNVVMSLGMALLFISILSMEISSSGFISRPSSGLIGNAFMAIMCVWWTARSITSVWWRANVRFGERGILWDRRALVWDYIVSWVWDVKKRDILDVRGIDQFERDMTLRVRVPDKLRSDLESLLQSQVKPKPGLEIRMPGNMLARAPLSVALRDKRFWSGCGFVILIYLLILFLAYSFPAGFTGVREFDHSIVNGIALFSLTRSYWLARRKSAAGIPIARLRRGSRWLLSLVWMLMATAVYYVGSMVGATSEYVGYIGGLAFGATIVLVIQCLWRSTFDLRANGVYVSGRFWPWHNVTITSWNEETGKLVLRHGRQQLESTVPIAQRRAVGDLVRMTRK